MQNNIISIIVAKIFGFKIIIRNSAPIDYYKIRNFFFGLVTLCVKSFVYKFSEWNYIISYKLPKEERTYIIKDGYIGPIYIHKGSEITILKED
jgi:hypothetical protein